MGKTKNRKKVKKGKKNFSRKNGKMRGGAFFDNFVRRFLSILLFGIFFYIQCAVLNQTFHAQMSIPYMKDIHTWFLLIKNFCTFLDKYYPNNIFTQNLYGAIKYAVQQIPNETARNAIENAIPAIILRPNILKGTHYIIKNYIPESKMRELFMVLSKNVEQSSEYMRIFNLDLDASKNIGDLLYDNNNLNKLSVTDYTRLLHIANNFESKSNEIITYINKLLLQIYNRSKSKINIEEMFFERETTLKHLKIITDVHNALNDELSQEIKDYINNGVEFVNKIIENTNIELILGLY